MKQNQEKKEVEVVMVLTEEISEAETEEMTVPEELISRPREYSNACFGDESRQIKHLSLEKKYIDVCNKKGVINNKLNGKNKYLFSVW